MYSGDFLIEKEYIEKYTHFQNNIYYVADLMNDNKMFTDSDRISLDTCGTYLSFGITDKNEIRLTGSNFCRKRYCPMCQWRKSEKQFSNCLKLADALENKGYRFLHLVLTVPNCAGGLDLINTIKKMNYAFSKFIKHKEIKRAYKGIMRCLEISYNYATHLFHPHFHCLIDVKSSYFHNPKHYMKHSVIVDLWTKSYNSNVALQCSVGAIKGDDKLGFAEVSKYCIKPLDFEKGNRAENAYIIYTLAYTLKGNRFIQTYGVIKDELKKIKDDNEVSDIIEQVFDYKWNFVTHKYEKVGNNEK